MKIFKRTVIVLAVLVLTGFAVTALFPEKIFNISAKMQRSSAGLKVKEIKFDDQKIVYLEGGTGEETLVLIHGFGANKDSWPLLVKHLPGYHFIIPDLPGFGESTKSDAVKYDVGSQVSRIDKFFSSIGLKRFFIAGNSMGGNIAGIYASRYPEKVRGLILLNNSGVNAPVKSTLVKSLDNGVNPLLVNSRDDYKRLMQFIFAKEPFIPYPFLAVLADTAVKNRKFNDKIFHDMVSSPAMLEDRFSSITMPVLIIWGDKDQVLDVSSVSVLEKGIKNHTTRILKDCGHVPMMERPGETAGFIKSFIESVK